MSRRKGMVLLVGSALLVRLLAWWLLASESLLEVAPRSTRFAFETERAPQIRRVVSSNHEGVVPLIVCNDLANRLGLEIAEQIELELDAFDISAHPESSPPPGVTVAPPGFDSGLRTQAARRSRGLVIVESPVVA